MDVIKDNIRICEGCGKETFEGKYCMECLLNQEEGE